MFIEVRALAVVAVVAVSANLALSTRTPKVVLPFHPIRVGYVPVQAAALFVLFTLPPSGEVP